MKELYKKRKETIERLFGTAKEYHNLRYTREKGKSKIEDKVGAYFGMLRYQKIGEMNSEYPFLFSPKSGFLDEISDDNENSFVNTKRQTSKCDVCLQAFFLCLW